MIRSALGLALASIVALPVAAQAPRVAVDIAPVHSLVAQVMEGVAVPDLIVAPGSSPHVYSMRPSQARALQNADLVVWVGAPLSPWLEKPLETLSENASTLALLSHERTKTLSYREIEDLGGDAHHDGHDGHDDHGDHGDDDHGHDGHDDHGDDHDDHKDAQGDDHGDDHEEGHKDAHGHDHSAWDVDAHAWLSPENATIWLDLIAQKLAALDPEHADLYATNAQKGQAAIVSAVAQVEQDLSAMQGQPYAAFHDAYQYFETRFGLNLVGTVTLSDDADPSPAQVAKLRDALQEHDISCAFVGNTGKPALLQSAAGGQDLTIVNLDPLGQRSDLGPDLYPQLLRNMGQDMAKCAK